MTFLAIQILRAIAAGIVVVSHVQYDLFVHLGTSILPDFTIGTFGVDLFFVISGFIMVYASETLFASPDATKRFLLRRIIRIVPLYWAVTSLYLIAYLKFPDMIAANLTESFILASYMFFPAARPNGIVQPLAAQGWTLNYEMFFYLMFSAALWNTRRAAIIFVTFILLTFVIVGAVAQPTSVALKFWSSPIMLEFMMGMLIGLGFREGIRLHYSIRWLLILTGVVILVLNMPAIDRERSVLINATSAALIVSGCVFTPPRPYHSWLARGLSRLGDTSYSLYLTHGLIVRIIREIAVRSQIPFAAYPWIYLSTVVVLAEVGSILVFLVFEHPVTRALNGRLRIAKFIKPVAQT